MDSNETGMNPDAMIGKNIKWAVDWSRNLKSNMLPTELHGLGNNPQVEVEDF